jgi:hypothetical protein
LQKAGWRGWFLGGRGAPSQRRQGEAEGAQSHEGRPPASARAVHTRFLFENRLESKLRRP